ncbi:HNH endonuclease signature motif containing protein, partial [Intrasporangium mesophilum]
MEGELAAFELGERAKAVVDARQLDALARMHASMSAEFRAREAQTWVGRTPLTVHEAVVLEVVAATGLGESEVGLRLDLAIAPASRAGFLREQVALGRTTMARATQVVHATRHLDDQHADTVARAVLAPTRDGTGLAGALFRQRLRRAVIAADTDHAARRRAARDRIGAFAQVHDDGTGTLTVINDAEKIVAAIDRADTAARGARAGGDPRTLDQLRADFLTGAAMFAGTPDRPTTSSTTSSTSSTSITSTPATNGWSPPPGTAPPGTALPEAALSAGHPNARDDAGAGVPADVASHARDGAVGGVPGGVESHARDGAVGGVPGDVESHPRDDMVGAVPGNVDSDAGGDAVDDAAAVAGGVEAEDGGSGAGFWRRPPATVWIIVPFSTAAGLDDQPCELPGHGWVSAAHARQIITAPGSIWHTLYADAPTGHAIRLTHPGYRPTAEIIRHVQAVDGHCRAPGCTVPAHRCDLDHDIPAPHGPTSTDNLSATHRQHHRIRTTGLWTTDRDPDIGTLTWTTAAGRTYTTHPKDWL